MSYSKTGLLLYVSMEWHVYFSDVTSLTLVGLVHNAMTDSSSSRKEVELPKLCDDLLYIHIYRSSSCHNQMFLWRKLWSWQSWGCYLTQPTCSTSIEDQEPCRHGTAVPDSSGPPSRNIHPAMTQNLLWNWDKGVNFPRFHSSQALVRCPWTIQSMDMKQDLWGCPVVSGTRAAGPLGSVNCDVGPPWIS